MIKQWKHEYRHALPAFAYGLVETFMWIQFDAAGRGSSDG